MFAALQLKLKEIAATTVNGPDSDSSYITPPSNIIDSGASLSFVRNIRDLSNPNKPVKALQTAEGKEKFSTHAEKIQ